MNGGSRPGSKLAQTAQTSKSGRGSPIKSFNAKQSFDSQKVKQYKVGLPGTKAPPHNMMISRNYETAKPYHQEMRKSVISGNSSGDPTTSTLIDVSPVQRVPVSTKS